MKEDEVYLTQLGPEALEEILELTKLLNPDKPLEELKARQLEMFRFDHYYCFGLMEKGQLLGLCSGWITVRLYSGKQLELDNVIINQQLQSKGLGNIFMQLLQDWAKEQGCKTIELNTYVQNSRSHKFYFNQGFVILGYHFQKQL